jgi:hypothetical protein
MWGAAGLLLFVAGLGVWVWAVGRFLWDRWRGVPLPPAGALGGRLRPAVAGVVLEEDRRVALDDPEIPPSIRAMVQADAQPGDTLWRCVRLGGRSGPLAWFTSGERPLVLEWWLLDAEGDLVEGYWLER